MSVSLMDVEDLTLRLQRFTFQSPQPPPPLLQTTQTLPSHVPEQSAVLPRRIGFLNDQHLSPRVKGSSSGVQDAMECIQSVARTAGRPLASFTANAPVKEPQPGDGLRKSKFATQSPSMTISTPASISSNPHDRVNVNHVNYTDCDEKISITKQAPRSSDISRQFTAERLKEIRAKCNPNMSLEFTSEGRSVSLSRSMVEAPKFVCAFPNSTAKSEHAAQESLPHAEHERSATSITVTSPVVSNRYGDSDRPQEAPSGLGSSRYATNVTATKEQSICSSSSFGLNAVISRPASKLDEVVGSVATISNGTSKLERCVLLSANPVHESWSSELSEDSSPEHLEDEQNIGTSKYSRPQGTTEHAMPKSKKCPPSVHSPSQPHVALISSTMTKTSKFSPSNKSVPRPQTYVIPRAVDYPELLPMLFEDEGKTTFSRLSNGRLHTEKKVRQVQGGHTTVTYSIDIIDIGRFSGKSVKPHCTDTRPASIAAYNDLLANLHAKGLLKRMFSVYSTLKSRPPTEETTKANARTTTTPAQPPAVLSSKMLKIVGLRTSKLFIRESGLEILEKGVKALERLGVPLDHGPLTAATSFVHSGLGGFKLGVKQRAERNEALLNRMNRLSTDSNWKEMRKLVSQLPIRNASAKLLELLGKHPIVIVKSATGSGKTTQVPQIILEDAIQRGHGANCNIIVTQPRQIAATKVAERVKEERFDVDEKSKEDANTVGHHVRFDAKLPYYGGSICFCTTGILIKRLQGSLDELLESYSHIIVDEVHERDVNIDFLLNIISFAAKTRLHTKGVRFPKIILMSATIDTTLFVRYFSGIPTPYGPTQCPILDVKGRTFGVEDVFLHQIMEQIVQKHGSSVLRFGRDDPGSDAYIQCETDHQNRAQGIPVSGPALSLTREKEQSLLPLGLIATVIAYISLGQDSQAILAFLPGEKEIIDCAMYLVEKRPLGVCFGNEGKFEVVQFFAKSNNLQGLKSKASKGCRKIVLATNVAETSLTLPDVGHVVDICKVKIKRHDVNTDISSLRTEWAGMSNAQQRRGRTGRVAPGRYYALYSQARSRSLQENVDPEMSRLNLEEICLRAKDQERRIPHFFADCIEPPPASDVDKAVRKLIDLEALTTEEALSGVEV